MFITNSFHHDGCDISPQLEFPVFKYCIVTHLMTDGWTLCI